MNRILNASVLMIALLTGFACSSDPSEPNSDTTSGGSSKGGTPASGGMTSTGGKSQGGVAGNNVVLNGGSSQAGSFAMGGTSVGGVSVLGGTNSSTGGVVAQAGGAASGGATVIGGSSSLIGGTSAAGASSGGVTAAGASSQGGTSNTTGGMISSGGTSQAGSTSTITGGVTGIGGSSSAGSSTILIGGTTSMGGVSATGGIPPIGGTSSEGGSATGGNSSAGGVASSGGTTSTTSVAGAAGTAPSCVTGLDPIVSTPEPFTCTTGFVRDTAFDEMNTSRGQDLAIAIDAWSYKGIDYAIASDYGRNYAFQRATTGEWSLMTSLPEGFSPARFREVEDKLCVAGGAGNPTNGVLNAKLYCMEEGIWMEQSVGFCPTGCLSGSFLDIRVTDISSADHTTALIAKGMFDGVWPRDDSDQVFLKKQGSPWIRQSLPLSAGLRLQGVWVHSDCDAYAVGQYGGVAVALHYDGSTWSRLMTIPSGIFTFLAVHGNGSEVWITGMTETIAGVSSSVAISSSDLVNWHTETLSSIPGENVTGSAIWSPKLGAALILQSSYVAGTGACGFVGGNADAISQHTPNGSFFFSIDGFAMRTLRSIHKNEGVYIVAADGYGFDCTNNSTAAIYHQASCQ